MAQLSFKRYATTSSLNTAKASGSLQEGNVVFDAELKILYIVTIKSGNIELEPYYGTNTTYTFSGDGTNTLKIKPSNANEQSITINNVVQAANATKATNDSDGNKISSTYLKLSGGTLTGALTVKSSITSDSITTEDLVVNGAARFISGITSNTTITAPTFKGNLEGTANVAKECSGNAASANKLNTNAGSATLPVYFSNGVPVAINKTGVEISITGNAATATNATNSTNSTYLGNSSKGYTYDSLTTILAKKSDVEHNHDDLYLKLTGGTINGNLTIVGTSNIDDLQTGSLLVNGQARFLNEIEGTSKYSTHLGTSSNNYTYESLAAILAQKADKSSIPGSSLVTDRSKYADAIRHPDYHDMSHRLTSMNQLFSDGALHYFLATSSCITAKPAYDSQIIHTAWDNSNIGAQISVPHDENTSIQWRTYNTSWSNWISIIDQNNWKTYIGTTSNPVANATNAATATISNRAYNADNATKFNNKDISSFYRKGCFIDTQMEGDCTQSLDGGNCLYAFYKRGGTCDAYEYDATVDSNNIPDFSDIDLSSKKTTTTVGQFPDIAFDGSASQTASNSYQGTKYAVYDLNLPKDGFSWTSNIFLSFGVWRPEILLIYVYFPQINKYVQQYKGVSNNNKNVYTYINPKDSTIIDCHFTKIRIVASKWNRIFAIGINNYGGIGLRSTYMSTVSDDSIYRNITPANASTYNLGSDNYKWKNIYASNFYGLFNGNVNGTASKATLADNASNSDKFGGLETSDFTRSFYKKWTGIKTEGWYRIVSTKQDVSYSNGYIRFITRQSSPNPVYNSITVSLNSNGNGWDQNVVTVIPGAWTNYQCIKKVGYVRKSGDIEYIDLYLTPSTNDTANVGLTAWWTNGNFNFNETIDVGAKIPEGYERIEYNVDFTSKAININILGNAATATISSKSTLSDSATKSDYLSGFSKRGTSIIWGVLRESNGYAYITDLQTKNLGDIAFAEKNGQLHVQIDGFFYQNEGAYRVIDQNNWKDYIGTSSSPVQNAVNAASVPWSGVQNKPNLATIDTEQTISAAKTFNSSVNITSELNADSATLGNLIVNGTSKFLNTINGNLKGDVDGNAKTATSAITATTANKVAKSLKWGSKSYDGSSEQTVTAADLGLSGAMHFLGVTTSNVNEGSTLTSIVVDGKSVTPSKGDVVLYSHSEYIWTGSKWEELGSEQSFALKSVQIVAGSGLSGGGTLENTRTISHGDTSSQASVTTGGRTYINKIVLDDFGHVTSLSTGTESDQVDISGNAGSANKLNTNAGSNTQPVYFKDGIPVAVTGTINGTTSNSNYLNCLDTRKANDAPYTQKKQLRYELKESSVVGISEGIYVGLLSLCPWIDTAGGYHYQLAFGDNNIYYRKGKDSWSTWSQFASKSDIPTKLSQLTDDLGDSPAHTHKQYALKAGDTITGKYKFTAGLESDSITTEDLIVNGSARFVSGLTSNANITATTFTGALKGNADTATNAQNSAKADLATKADTVTTVAASADSNRPVFFAYAGDNSKICYNTNFQYNPSTKNLFVSNINGGTPITSANISSQSVASAKTAESATTAGQIASHSLWGQTFNGTQDINGNITLSSGFMISGAREINNEPGNTNHTLCLGYSGHDYVEWKEYGGDWRFIQSKEGTNTTQVLLGTTNYFLNNVGIGNQSPAYKLDVTGTARITGDVVMSSNLNVAATTTSQNVTATNQVKGKTINIDSRCTLQYDSTEQCVKFVFA